MMDNPPETSRVVSSDAAASPSFSSPCSSSFSPSTPARGSVMEKTWSSASSPAPPASVVRLWRPAAQRNMRNQWSRLASCRQQWVSSSSTARSHATSLVNAHLSQRYTPAMELGVLKDMPNITSKARQKWLKQQLLFKSKLVSSYKDMVAAVIHMVKATASMRYFLKGSSDSPLLNFSSCLEDTNDIGDGGGIPVFTFSSILIFENLAQELIEMFESELSLKRLLTLEFLSIGCEALASGQISWSQELYSGEFEDLSACHLYTEKCKLLHPRLKDHTSDIPSVHCSSQFNPDTLQVYITTWLTEVNIDYHRVDEIFKIVGEEMHVNFQ